MHVDVSTHVQKVMDLCAVAGFPGLAERFIAEGYSIHDVRAELQRLRAGSASSETLITAHGTGARPDNNHGWDRIFRAAAPERYTAARIAV